MRERVLQWLPVTIARLNLTDEGEAAVRSAISNALNSYPQGTPEKTLVAARDQVLSLVRDAIAERHRQQAQQTARMLEERAVSERQAREASAQAEKKQALVEGGLRAVGPYLQKLEEDWEFDADLSAVEMRIKDPIRKRLLSEVEGSESPEEVAKKARRLVRAELNIRPSNRS